MAPHATADCDGGRLRGADCEFDLSTYTTATAVIWILTALPLLLWASPCLRRQWSASRPARASLLLAASSAICCCIDDLLEFQEAGYGNMTLWSVGSILLVFALCIFSLAWCDVASALEARHANGGEEAGARLISHVRMTYKWMSLMHVPFAVMFSVHDYEFMKGQRALAVFQVWGAWLLFGTLVVMTGLAITQVYISRVCLAGVEGTGSLRCTALINLGQQAIFDILIFVWAVLYSADNSTSGSNIAAYHAVGFVTFWAMHVQLVLFFATLRNSDPLYSKDEWSALIENNGTLKDMAEREEKVAPTKVGSPLSKV